MRASARAVGERWLRLPGLQLRRESHGLVESVAERLSISTVRRRLWQRKLPVARRHAGVALKQSALYSQASICMR